MIKLIIISIITIIIGGLLQKSSQFISFTYNNTPIQVSIWLILAVSTTLIFWQLWLLATAFKYWLQYRSINKEIKQLKKTLFAFVADEPTTVEKYALKLNNNSHFKWLALLIAANAAKEQQLWEKSHKYLIKAELFLNHTSSLLNFNQDNETITFGLIRSEIYYDAKEYEKCINELKKLHKEFQDNKKILLQLAKTYKKLNNQEELIKLTPKLNKYKLII